MKNSRFFLIPITLVLCVFAASFLLAQFFLPSQITLMQREGEADYTLNLPFFLSVNTDELEYSGTKAIPAVESNESITCYKKDGTICLRAVQAGESEITLRLLGFLPVKNVVVKVLPETTVYAGGDAIGLSLRAGGLVVVDFKNFQNENGDSCNPAEAAGLRRGDKILTCNGQEVTDSDDFARLVSTGEGAPLQLTYERDGVVSEILITPQLSKEDNLYRLGMWVRDGTDGIGILTFINEKTGVYGAIGHGIQDTDLEELCALEYGFAMKARVIGIQKGLSGAPGELKGMFDNTDTPLGNVLYQDETGVYGTYFFDSAVGKEALTGRQKLEIGLSFEVKTGPATILTTIGDDGIQEYDIEITQVYYNRVNSTKSMIIQVTDEDLLARTGGIVQGMSGSPLIQNGKLIGAVTHVLVNDPTRGYGIFIENMLETANQVAEE